MAGQTTKPIIDDAQAEGRLRAREPVEQIESAGEGAAHYAPGEPQQPVAETGVVRAVPAAEGPDSTDRQDAPMTQPENGAAEPISPLVQVLIVEDTLELAELIAISLRRADIAAGYELRGEHAFARYVALQPAVVLLDLNLPDMTGWKVLESIKSHVKQAGSPMPRIIVMTAMGDPANRLVGKLQGVYSYLVKPFSTAEVQRVVKNALDDQA